MLVIFEWASGLLPCIYPASIIESFRSETPAAKRRLLLTSPGGARTRVRTQILGLVYAMLLIAAGPSPRFVDWSKAQPVDVTMVEYRFIPDHLTFRRGLAYRLHLENHGKELHEFTAPDFLASVTVRDPRVLWTGGQEVAVQPGASADIDFIPRRSGRYDLSCADHDWAGMTGQIIVQ
jgi:plastocyanin